jgi:hypothetical protein
VQPYTPLGPDQVNVLLLNVSEEQLRRGIAGEVRKLEEEVDEDYIPIRMIAIYEAEETMQRAVAERNNPTSFCA